MERSHKLSIKPAHIDTASILQRQGIPMSLLKWAIILFIVIAVLVLILGLTVGHAVF